MRRFIITGAPGAGKTAIIRQLELDGFSVVEEAATDVIATLQRDRQIRASFQADEVQVHDRCASDRYGAPEGASRFRVACSKAYAIARSLGSLQAVPVKLTPKGCNRGANASGNGIVAPFGTMPNGTITVGYPGRAASADPLEPGNKSASSRSRFITSSMPCAAVRYRSFARSAS